MPVIAENSVPRPGGMSDSEDDYSDDGFDMFSGDRYLNYNGFNEHDQLAREQPQPQLNEQQVQQRHNMDLARTIIETAGAYGNQLEPLKSILVKDDFNINDERIDNGWTLLHYACKSANPSIIKLLIEHGSNINHIAQSDGFPPFLALATSEYKNDTNVISKCLDILVENGANLTLPEHNGMNPVMYAAKNNLLELMLLFIEHGIDPDQPNTDGQTALHYAAEEGHGIIIRALLEKGVQVDRISLDGVSPYDLAIMKNHNTIAEVLYKASTTKWIPGSDPALMQELVENSPFHVETQRDRVILNHRDQISMTLEKLGLAQLMPLFQKHNITYLTFLRLNMDDLKEIGVEEVGDRWKILDCIRILHNADWNKSSINSAFLNGIITNPEIICLLNDTTKHLEFMTQSIAYLQDRLKAEPKALLSGSEFCQPKALRKYTEKIAEASNKLNAKSKDLIGFFESVEMNPEFRIGDEISSKQSNSALFSTNRAIMCTLLIGGTLAYLTYGFNRWKTIRLPKLSFSFY